MPVIYKKKEQFFNLYHNDCLTQLRLLPSNSIDACISDPPAGISFCSAKWDHDKGGRDQWVRWMTRVMVEVYRVLKPGGYICIWSIGRTMHWTGWAIESAGFEVKTQIVHINGQSMPKSMDISKAIDKEFGLEREVIGVKPGHEEFAFRETTGHLDGTGGSNAFDRPWMHDPEKQKAHHLKTAPASKQAEKWDGWGTQIKTSAEPWWLAQKPISESTIAKNVLKWGVGGINIDKSRVPLASVGEDKRLGGKGTWKTDNMAKNTYEGGYAGVEVTSSQLGRFPSNVILTHTGECFEYEDRSYICHPDCPVSQFPDSLGQRGDLVNHSSTRESPNGIFGKYPSAADHLKREETSVSAARFFYTSKASKRDRDAYVPEGMSNKHLTIKSNKLMKYFITLVCPPKGVVLDMFCGSGSGGIAALEDGFSFIGIEKEKEFYDLSHARLTNCLTKIKGRTL